MRSAWSESVPEACSVCNRTSHKHCNRYTPSSAAAANCGPPIDADCKNRRIKGDRVFYHVGDHHGYEPTSTHSFGVRAAGIFRTRNAHGASAIAHDSASPRKSSPRGLRRPKWTVSRHALADLSCNVRNLSGIARRIYALRSSPARRTSLVGHGYANRSRARRHSPRLRDGPHRETPFRRVRPARQKSLSPQLLGGYPVGNRVADHPDAGATFGRSLRVRVARAPRHKYLEVRRVLRCILSAHWIL